MDIINKINKNACQIIFDSYNLIKSTTDTLDCRYHIMKKVIIFLKVIIVITLSAILITSVQLAFALDNNIESYVDLDGDGFDDNTPDIDNNGIPDRFEISGKNETNPIEVASVSFFANLEKSSPTVLLLSASEKFSLRKFSCRTLDKCRSNLDSDFSGGIGFGNASGGGACAGGVCF